MSPYFRGFLVAIVISTGACAVSPKGVSQSQHEAKLREISELRAENQRLKATADELQHGAARLLDNAVAAFENGAYTQAVNIAQTLVAKYSSSQEAIRARTIISQAQSAIQKAEAADRRTREQALAGMVKKRDEMLSLNVWRDHAMPAHVNSRSWVGAYIVAPDNDAPYLRFAIYYAADDWLFIERYRFKVDGQDFILTPDTFGSDAVERDNGSGDIWEWWDVTAEGQVRSVLEAISKAKSASIRYEGRQYYRDRTLGAEERAAMHRTLLALQALEKAR